MTSATIATELGNIEVDLFDQSAPKAAATKLTGAVGSAFDSEHFARSLAGALILLLTAAHLRRWLGTPRDSGRPTTSARPARSPPRRSRSTTRSAA